LYKLEFEGKELVQYTRHISNIIDVSQLSLYI
jgi:hypothetical protein